MAVKSNVVIRHGAIGTTVTVDSGRDKPKSSLTTLCTGQPGNAEHAPAAITMPATCSACGPVLDRSALKKGQKVGDGWAVIDPDAIAEAKLLAPAEASTVSLTPHPREDVEALTATGDKLYYLRPTQQRGNYDALAQLIVAHPELAFVGVFVPRSAPALFVASARDDGNGSLVLVLSERTYADGVRALPDLSASVAMSEDEARDFEGIVEDAELLLPRKVKPFEVSTYTNAQAAAIDELVAAAEVVAGMAEAADATGPTPIAVGSSLREALKAELAAINTGNGSKPTGRKPRAAKKVA